MNRKGHKRRAGLTLVEVVVSIGLFMLGTLGLFAMLGQIRSMSTLTAAYGEAAVAASSRMETLRALPVESLTSGVATVGTQRVTWTVASAPGYRTRAVRVNVQWLDIAGDQHARAFNTVIASVK